MNIMDNHPHSEAAPSQRFLIGVDIGGTKIWMHLSDFGGNVIHKKKVATTSDYRKLCEYIMEFVREASVSLDMVAAIGFGVPGITNSESGVIIEAPALQWKNEPFIDNMKALIHRPIFVNNDVNCAALGERWVGSAKNSSDFVFIAIGTGVGSAIVANGTLVQGSQYMAGEIAYLAVDEDIRNHQVNKFGDYGMFEKKTSGLALSRHGCPAEELFARYRNGDEFAAQIIGQFVTDLSLGVANIVSLLNPEKVVIGGGVSRSMPAVMEALTASVARITPIPFRLELSQLGEHAGAIGAAAFAADRIAQLKKEAVS
ncbi:ROK family protein [Gordoniibacillus kamchatkensis]|uniref:ROK family protein n=1 Tax=Gordoniibacillus kamchatkensis TaxID=1590651 RepID=UPI000695A713|nr:ROK family protein [Paenibacillus sp. VKM B-2647]